MPSLKCAVRCDVANYLRIGVSAALLVALMIAGWAVLRPPEARSEARATVAGLQRDANSDRFASQPQIGRAHV